MAVHLYAICWNEGVMMAFFLRHYESFVDRFVIFDDGSTDGTLEILRAHPKVELRRASRRVRNSLVLSMLAIYQQAWKESRGKADWVIITNIDEHLYHPSMLGYLADCRAQGVTAIPALGYNMISEAMPDASLRLSEAVTKGVINHHMSKLGIFNPDAVREVNYGAGRHQAWPRGRIVWPVRDEVMNLHFKYVGRSRIESRHVAMHAGLGSLDRRRGWGFHYRPSETPADEKWETFARRAQDVAQPGFEPWRDYDSRRWWREPPNERLRGFAWTQWRRWMALRSLLG
jgi:glycosyltransferase involved in cell wall biosynthesis